MDLINKKAYLHGPRALAAHLTKRRLITPALGGVSKVSTYLLTLEQPIVRRRDTQPLGHALARSTCPILRRLPAER